MDINKIFDEISVQMRSDIDAARAVLTHPGQKGASFEESFRKFLRSYLPSSLDISTGIIFDSQGSSSKQLDVIISDRLRTPIYYRSGDIRVIPTECVYAVIEVKSYLDGKELDKAFENMVSVRRLNKIAYYRPHGFIYKGIHTDDLYGKLWHIWPTNYMIFAYESIDLHELAKALNNLHCDNNVPVWSRVDMICVLDKGVICNQLEDGTHNALPEPKSQLYVCSTPKALLLFYTLYSKYIFQTRLPNFKFMDYVDQIRFE